MSLDAYTTRQLYLIRVAGGESKLTKRTLDDLEAEIAALLLTIRAHNSARVVRRVQLAIKRAYDAIKQDLEEISMVVQDDERRWLEMQGAPVDQDKKHSGLVLGLTIAELMATQAESLRLKIAQAIRAQSQGLANYIATGEALKNAMQRAARAAANSVESVVSAASSAMRVAIFGRVKWVGMLDGRMCAICGEKHGKVWQDGEPVGHNVPLNRKPPVHYRCRCFLMPDDGKDTPSFDAWLKSQSKEQVEESLGVRKAEMYRAGKITLSDLVDQAGMIVPLRDLP